MGNLKKGFPLGQTPLTNPPAGKGGTGANVPLFFIDRRPRPLCY